MGLFTPKWMEDPKETKKLTDQKKLQRAFAKAHHPEVLKAAGWRIEDQAFLVDVLEHSHGRFIDTLKWELLGRITRPELLEHIINIGYRDGVGFTCLDRQVAIRKVKDQALLTRIALEDELPDNRKLALQCLTDLDALRRVASESRDSWLRERAAAIVKANEPKKPASKAQAPEPRAVPRPQRPQKPREEADDVTLIARFEAAVDDEARLAALRQVKDEAFHAAIARGEYAPALRAVAVNHLRDQALLAAIFRSAGDGEVARAALKKLTDQALLAEVARSEYSEETRALAISRLNDAGTLADLALDGAQPEALHRAALEKLMKMKDVAALEKVLAGLEDGIERTNVAGAVKALGSRAADDYIARQRYYSDAARRKKLDEYNAVRSIGRALPTNAGSSSATLPRPSGGFNALTGPAAAEYVNRLSPRQLMELILFGEDGQEANNVIWLCNRLAAKMMIPYETGDRATIEMFFLVFSGVSARDHYRALTGFWPPNQAESAFTQTMLQFAALPKNLRDIHARLYVEHCGRL